MPETRTYYAIKFDDGTHGIWYEKKANKISIKRVQVEFEHDYYQGEILFSGKKRDAIEFFANSEIPVDAYSSDDEDGIF